MAKAPKLKTKVVHSLTSSQWNVVGESIPGKFKIAKVPYVASSENAEVSSINRLEAYGHAEWISYCFNNAQEIHEKLAKAKTQISAEALINLDFKSLY